MENDSKLTYPLLKEEILFFLSNVHLTYIPKFARDTLNRNMITWRRTSNCYYTCQRCKTSVVIQWSVEGWGTCTNFIIKPPHRPPRWCHGRERLVFCRFTTRQPENHQTKPWTIYDKRRKLDWKWTNLPPGFSFYGIAWLFTWATSPTTDKIKIVKWTPCDDNKRRFNSK